MTTSKTKRYRPHDAAAYSYVVALADGDTAAIRRALAVYRITDGKGSSDALTNAVERINAEVAYARENGGRVADTSEVTNGNVGNDRTVGDRLHKLADALGVNVGDLSPAIGYRVAKGLPAKVLGENGKRTKADLAHLRVIGTSSDPAEIREHADKLNAAVRKRGDKAGGRKPKAVNEDGSIPKAKRTPRGETVNGGKPAETETNESPQLAETPPDPAELLVAAVDAINRLPVGLIPKLLKRIDGNRRDAFAEALGATV